MEVRKVQMTGGSSYIVTLPKEWVKSASIQKNDPVGLIIQPDGTLLITTNTSGLQKERKKELNADDYSDHDFLFRMLVGIYIQGYREITITSKSRMSPVVRECVREFTQSAVGPEILEETEKSIVVKDLLSPMEMPVDKIVRRMFILVRTMHEDAANAMEKGDKDLLGAVISRDDEVDRLQWLVEHQYHIVSKESGLAQKMGISPSEATFYFRVGRIIERIGDHAVKIAKNATILFEDKNPSNIVPLVDISQLAIETLKDSEKAWFKKDMYLANANIERIADLVDKCRATNKLAMDEGGEAALHMGHVIEGIRRTGEYAGDISELAMNYLVDEI